MDLKPSAAPIRIFQLCHICQKREAIAFIIGFSHVCMHAYVTLLPQIGISRQNPVVWGQFVTKHGLPTYTIICLLCM